MLGITKYPAAPGSDVSPAARGVIEHRELAPRPGPAERALIPGKVAVGEGPAVPPREANILAPPVGEPGGRSDGAEPAALMTRSGRLWTA